MVGVRGFEHAVSAQPINMNPSVPPDRTHHQVGCICSMKPGANLGQWRITRIRLKSKACEIRSQAFFVWYGKSTRNVQHQVGPVCAAGHLVEVSAGHRAGFELCRRSVGTALAVALAGSGRWHFFGGHCLVAAVFVYWQGLRRDRRRRRSDGAQLPRVSRGVRESSVRPLRDGRQSAWAAGATTSTFISPSI